MSGKKGEEEQKELLLTLDTSPSIKHSLFESEFVDFFLRRKEYFARNHSTLEDFLGNFL
jgi:hypothetical protein